MGVRVEQTKLIVQTRRKTSVWRGPDKLLATHSYTYAKMLALKPCTKDATRSLHRHV